MQQVAFFLAAFKILPLSLAYDNLIIICLNVDFFVFILLRVARAS